MCRQDSLHGTGTNEARCRPTCRDSVCTAVVHSLHPSGQTPALADSYHAQCTPAWADACRMHASRKNALGARSTVQPAGPGAEHKRCECFPQCMPLWALANPAGEGLAFFLSFSPSGLTAPALPSAYTKCMSLPCLPLIGPSLLPLSMHAITGARQSSGVVEGYPSLPPCAPAPSTRSGQHVALYAA